MKIQFRIRGLNANASLRAWGDYEYCLVVDGQWMPDPLGAETVPSPFGGPELGSQGGQRRLTIPDRTDWRGNVR